MPDWETIPRSMGSAGRFPIFFPSVSSVKTNARPVDYIRLLRALHHPRLLVSAYDLGNAPEAERHDILRLLYEARGSGACVLLDSGNYESYWMQDPKWTQDRYHRELIMGASDVSLSFDRVGSSDTVDESAAAAIANFSADAGVATSDLVAIVHGSPATLPEACRAVADHLDARALAIPERELGIGVVERFRTLVRVRESLGAERSIRLHLLGTGNPASMLLYALAGADSFDGLEWCQTVVDHESGHLHHLAHYPLFQHQTRYGAAAELPPMARALAHNLEFFAKWESELVSAREAGRVRELVATRIPRALELLDV